MSQKAASNPEHRRVLNAIADRLIAEGYPAAEAMRLAYESYLRVTLKQQAQQSRILQ